MNKQPVWTIPPHVTVWHYHRHLGVRLNQGILHGNKRPTTQVLGHSPANTTTPIGMNQLRNFTQEQVSCNPRRSHKRAN